MKHLMRAKIQTFSAYINASLRSDLLLYDGFCKQNLVRASTG